MKIDYKAILDLFVWKEDKTRFAMHRPFYKEGFAAATNGHVLCLVNENLVSLPSAPKDAKYPTVSAVIPTDLPIPIQIQREQLFSDSLQKVENRYEAAIKNPGKEDCDMCAGDKEHECDCGDVHLCPDCEGTGTQDVLVKYDNTALLNGKPFRYGYLAMVRKAAEIAGEQALTYFDTGENKQAVIDFGKVRCVLMPLRSDSVISRAPELLETAEAK